MQVIGNKYKCCFKAKTKVFRVLSSILLKYFWILFYIIDYIRNTQLSSFSLYCILIHKLFCLTPYNLWSERCTCQFGVHCLLAQYAWPQAGKTMLELNLMLLIWHCSSDLICFVVYIYPCKNQFTFWLV